MKLCQVNLYQMLICSHLASQVPKLLDKQGGQLLSVALLIFSRTVISDRIASLNGWFLQYLLLSEEPHIKFCLIYLIFRDYCEVCLGAG